MTDQAADPGAHLQQAAQRKRQAQGLQERLAAAVALGDGTTDRVRAVRARLVDETQDVDRLENLSWKRLLTGLTGTRDTDLQREKAEQTEAQYAVAVAEEQDRAARAEVVSLRSQLDDLGDVDGDLAAALTAQEQWASAHDAVAGPELAALATRRGEAVAEADATGRAHDVGTTAAGLLAEAAELLEKASSWATWDTFGLGGTITEMAKYDRLDQVSRVLRGADEALGAFSRELGDVGVGPVGGVAITQSGRTFDVFFDNIFSDLTVLGRIEDALERVGSSRQQVGQALARLTERRAALSQEVADLDRRREALLLG